MWLWGSDRRVRSRARQALRTLGVEPPLQVDELCRRYGDHRGRPIRLLERSLGPRLSGLTLVGEHEDMIIYEKETTSEHQHFVVTHELGHLMLGHEPDAPDDQFLVDFWRELMPDVPEQQLRGALRRSCSDDRHERDAEATARIIRTWAATLDHLHPRGYEPDTPPWVRSGFGDRMGWL